MLSTFSCTFGYLCVFLGKLSIQILCPLLIGIFGFYWVLWVSYIFQALTFIWKMFCKKNFPICRFPCFLFMLLIISLFLVQKLFSLMLSHLFIFDLLLWCHIKKCIIIKTKVKAQGPFQSPPVGLRSVHLISQCMSWRDSSQVP